MRTTTRVAIGVLVITATGAAAFLKRPAEAPVSAESAQIAALRDSVTGWQVRRSRSPMTDSLEVKIALIPDSIITGQRTDLILLLGCPRGPLKAMLVSTGSTFNSDDNYRSPVRIRWDDEPASSTSWDITDDLTALIARAPMQFVKDGLLPHRRLRMEVVGYSAHQVADFTVAGLEQHLAALRQGCPRAGI